MRSRMNVMWAGCLLLAAAALAGGCGGGAPEGANGDGALEASLDAERWTSFTDPESVAGGLLYVPVYSSVFHGAGDRELLLTVTLSIHNVNLDESIVITDVAYFNTDGHRIRDFVTGPAALGPMATRQFVIPQADDTGGTGANFLVKWESKQPVTRPAVESLMVSTASQLGMAFTCQGVTIRELRHARPDSP